MAAKACPKIKLFDKLSHAKTVDNKLYVFVLLTVEKSTEKYHSYY